MRAIPLALRERIIHLYQQGESTEEIAAFFGFCVATVRLTGPCAPWLFMGAMDGDLLKFHGSNGTRHSQTNVQRSAHIALS